MLPAFLITVVALLVLLFTGGTTAAVAKMAASTGFISMGVAAGGLQTLYGRIILLGLFFSWWGDLFLISHRENIFLLGLIAFFLAHVAYASSFVAIGVDLKYVLLALAVLALPAFVLVRWLNPHLGDMQYPVYAYMIVITLMVALAAGAVGEGATPLILVGALLFWLSDIFVARGRFVQPSDINGLIGLPLYYAAQIVFAYTIRLTR